MVTEQTVVDFYDFIEQHEDLISYDFESGLYVINDPTQVPQEVVEYVEGYNNDVKETNNAENVLGRLGL